MTYKWITDTTEPMGRSHNPNSKLEHPEYKIANIATFFPIQAILFVFFETPGCHILPAPYTVVILLHKQKCIISLRSVAAGCNWPCGCGGSTLIIHVLLTDQPTYLLNDFHTYLHTHI